MPAPADSLGEERKRKNLMRLELTKIQGGWFPKKINYKDVLKEGDGTDFIMLNIEFPRITFSTEHY
ncbi:MAG: hypothetical protein U5K79_01320 [Cyclobacteriaceae bacterium]|nr:hypothetical protein [Cyclobacteriaceae bacterium]